MKRTPVKDRLLAVFVVSAAICGCSDQRPVSNTPPAAVGVAEREAKRPSDVKSLLMSGRWLSTNGLSQGMIWRFNDGGQVFIEDTGGSIDESYRWEVISRNEGSRSIEIKYFQSSDPPNDYREWKWQFSPDGQSARIDNYRRKNGAIELKGEIRMTRKD